MYARCARMWNRSRHKCNWTCWLLIPYFAPSPSFSVCYFISFLSHILSRGEQTKRKVNFSIQRRAYINWDLYSTESCNCSHVIICRSKAQKIPNIFWRFIRWTGEKPTSRKYIVRRRFCRREHVSCGDNKIYVCEIETIHHQPVILCHTPMIRSIVFRILRRMCEYRIFTFKTIPICGLTVLSRHWTFDMIPRTDGKSAVCCVCVHDGNGCIEMSCESPLVG